MHDDIIFIVSIKNDIIIHCSVQYRQNSYMGLYTTLRGVVYHTTWGCIPHYMGLYTTLRGVVYHTTWGCIPHYMGLYTTLRGVVYHTTWGCIPHYVGLYTTLHGVVYYTISCVCRSCMKLTRTMTERSVSRSLRES